MSEQPEELVIALSSSPDLPDRNRSQPISFVEELLARSDSPNGALDWARVREVILRQNEEVKEEKHRRFLETSELIYKIVISGVAFTVGIVLFICHYDNAVYLIAAGLIPLLSRRKPTS